MRRIRFRFGLRTLICSVVLLSVTICLLGNHWRMQRQRVEAVNTLRREGYTVHWLAAEQSPWGRWARRPMVTPRLHRHPSRGDLFALEVLHEDSPGNVSEKRTCAVSALVDYVDSHDPNHVNQRLSEAISDSVAVFGELDLLGLQGVVSDSDLAGLRRVDWLDLASCRLDEFSFENLTFRHSVKRLDLTRVDLQETQCKSLANALSRLEYLAIGYSKLPEDGIESLQPLPNLHVLVLGESASRYRSQGTLEGFPTLREVILSRPMSVGWLRLQQLSRLERFSAMTLAGHARLHSVDVRKLECIDLPRLESIELRAVEACLERLPSLREVRLGGCRELYIQEAARLETLEAPMLESLQIESGSCGHACLASLPPSLNLCSLRITGDSSIVDETIGLLAKFPNLRHLKLIDCGNLSSDVCIALEERAK